MLTATGLTSIFVHDQDEALEFYVGKLGLEVHTDADLGFMRWLTVCVPGDRERQIFLQLPGPPLHDDATVEQIRELVAKGAGGGWISFSTDDCAKAYADLLARGVEFTQEPVTRDYGTDVALRDPFGNPLRIVQRADG